MAETEHVRASISQVSTHMYNNLMEEDAFNEVYKQRNGKLGIHALTITVICF